MIRTDTLIARIALYLFFAAPAALLFAVTWAPVLLKFQNGLGGMLGFFALIGYCVATIGIVNRAFPVE